MTVSVCSSVISKMVVMIVLDVILLDGDSVGSMRCFGRKKQENRKGWWVVLSV